MTEIYTPTPLFDITNIPNIASERQRAKKGIPSEFSHGYKELKAKARSNNPTFNNAEEVERPLTQ